MARETIRILGIDTSLRSTGVGIVEVRGNDLRAVAYGRIRNAPKVPHSLCLENIFNNLSDLIAEHKPEIAVIEGAFFAKNAKTAMILGQARGAAMTACAKKGLTIYELSPRRVKQAVVGTGSDHCGRGRPFPWSSDPRLQYRKIFGTTARLGSLSKRVLFPCNRGSPAIRR